MGKIMFYTDLKYFNERLKLECVFKYTLRMANKIHKSNAKCSKQFITL